MEQLKETTETAKEIPQEILAFWELLAHMSEKGSNVHEHVDWINGIVKSLSEKDPDFKEILAKHGTQDIGDMMDALEEYSRVLTEPEK
jgi:ubiquinone/menaquinone biosynthesis C-methylase UbiE